MLDTTATVIDHLKLLSDEIPVDFYCTSLFASGIPDTGFVRYFTRFNITPPAGTDPYTGAHSFAHQWFIETIASEAEQGFRRSPFSRKIAP